MYQLHIPGRIHQGRGHAWRRLVPTVRRRWIVWGPGAFLVLFGAEELGGWVPFFASSTERRVSQSSWPLSTNLSGDPSQDYSPMA